MTPATTNRCPQCDQPLPGDAREGLCPACLLAGALAPSAPGETLEDPNARAQTLAGASKDDARWPRIARYRILHLIDVGGMGEVYAAEQQQPHRTVALKVIRAGLSTHRNLQRFAYEAEALARLHHPGIAQVYESGTADSGAGIVPFFAMELVHGVGTQRPPTLTRYAQEHKLGTRQRLELVARVADAVHHAHQNGVIHRDLKPTNVLVDESGQPKVLDFGVARLTDADVQAVTLQTDVGQIIGTLPYMSPEQAGGDPAQIDTRTDVYGLGALAYELLTGRPPLELPKTPLHEAVRVIREEEPKSLSAVQRSLRGDVETIVAKALAKEKQRRYASAAEFAADIRRYLAHEPIAARPASARYQLAKFAKRNKAMVAGMAAVFLALLIGTATTTWQAFRANRQTANAIASRNAAKTAADEVRKQLRRIDELAGKFLDVDNLIVELPRSTGARKLIVSTALQYLDELGRIAPADLVIQQSLMRAYYKVAKVQGDPDSPNVHDTAGALDSFQKGSVICDRLIAARPNDLQLQITRARFQAYIGLMYHARGNDKDAMASLAEAVNLARLLLKDHPRQAELLVELATHLEGLARVTKGQHDLDRTKELYQEAHEIWSGIVADSPTTENLNQLAVTDLQLADVGFDLRQDLQAALSSCLEGLKIAQPLLAAQPHHLRLQRTVLSLGSKAADIQVVLGHSLEAYDDVPQYIAIAENLAHDLDNARAQRDLAHLYQTAGKLATNIGEFDIAVSYALKARDLYQTLVREDEADISTTQELWFSDFSLGGIHMMRAALEDDDDIQRRAKDYESAKQALEEGQRIALDLKDKGLLSAGDKDSLPLFSKGILTCTLWRLLPTAPPDPALKRLHSVYTPTTRSSTVPVPIRFHLVTAQKLAPAQRRYWRPLNDRFWEENRDSGAFYRFRVFGHWDDGKRKGTLVGLLPGRSYEVLIPSPLEDGAMLEYRMPGGPNWQSLGQIHLDRTPAEQAAQTQPSN